MNNDIEILDFGLAIEDESNQPNRHDVNNDWFCFNWENCGCEPKPKEPEKEENQTG